MPNSIREYLEKGRAGKVFDVNQNLWVDPISGKAFIPSFTNIRGNENMPVKPYRAGTFPSGPHGEDQVQYAGTPGQETPVEERPAMMVAPEEGVRMSPQGIPQKPEGMTPPNAPNPTNAAEMANHVVKQMVQRGEIKQTMGLPPNYRFMPNAKGEMSELEKAYRRNVSNTLRIMTDHYARRIEDKTKYRKDQLQKSGMKVKDVYELIDTLVNPPVNPITGKPERQPMSEDQAMDQVFDRLGKLNQRLGLAEQKAGVPQGGQQRIGGGQQGNVIGQIRDKKSGQMIDVYDDGTAMVGGQRRKVPPEIMRQIGGGKLPAPRTKGEVSPVPKAQPTSQKTPASKIPGRNAQAEIEAMTETGMPAPTFDYQRKVPQPYKDMYSRYLKQ